MVMSTVAGGHRDAIVAFFDQRRTYIYCVYLHVSWNLIPNCVLSLSPSEASVKWGVSWYICPKERAAYRELLLDICSCRGALALKVLVM